MTDILFEEAHASAFRKVSGDHNPLHWDKVYSQRTQFAEPVLYGVAGLIKCLGIFKREFSITDISNIRVTFKHPILLGQKFQFSFQKRPDGQIRFSLSQGKVEFQSGLVTLREAKTAQKKVNLSFGLEHPGYQKRNVTYSYEVADETVLRELTDLFGQDPPHPFSSQLHALLWVSYFVGMECPGKQALFTSLEMDCDLAPESVQKIFRQRIECTFDECFNQTTVQAEGEEIRARLESMQRPEPVDFSMEKVKEMFSEIDGFTEKKVLITGASRGFGHVMAQRFLSKGANVISIFSSYTKGAEELAKDAAQSEGTVRSIQVDLAKFSACQEVATQLSSDLDILINNASPQISDSAFLGKTDEQFLSFIEQSLALATRPIRALLPRVKKGGSIVFISSIWTREPKPNFSHYLTAKCAIEGFAKALAAEFPTHKFLVVRAPRMLTDQTNLPFQKEPPESPILVAAEVLRALNSFPPNENYLEI